MLSILSAEPAAGDMAVGAPIHFEEAEAVQPAEFEIVLGRRQLASVLFVATVAIAVFSSLAYLAGKTLAPAAKTVEVVRTVPVRVADPIPTATVVKPEPPLFAEPKVGPHYLQMGAVEKGIAVVFAEGLRKRGLEAFVAPGPNDHIFRVLIGPLADETEYRKAREAVDKLGVSTFARKYPEQ